MGGTKVCSDSPGHLTNLIVLPPDTFMVKILKNHLLWNQKADDLES